MTKVYLHRVDVLAEGDKVLYKPVPKKPKQENFGVEYSLDVEMIDDKHGRVYGWETGYPVGGSGGVKGVIYAPEGLGKDNIAFVMMNDAMLQASQMEDSSKSLEALCSNEEALLEAARTGQLEGFSLVGKIMY